jgi:hypothetical protein
MSSDTAFTDEDGIVYTDFALTKINRVGRIVVGMAGCLECMIEFYLTIIDFVSTSQEVLSVPRSIIESPERDFVAMVYVTNGASFFELKGP